MTKPRPEKDTPEAKERRQLKVNLDGLTDEQRDLRARLIHLGEMLYGDRWKKTMAVALGRTPDQLASWISGRRPVPREVLDYMRIIALIAAGDMRRKSQRLRLEWAPESLSDEERLRIAKEDELGEAFPPGPPRSQMTTEQQVELIVSELLLDVPADSFDA
jgi:hypothetical protein